MEFRIQRVPAPPTPTIGREADLSGLGALVRQPGTRLVTLVGLGGVGKTRLALALARSSADRFPDSVYFVGLAPVGSHEHVASSCWTTSSTSWTRRRLSRTWSQLRATSRCW